MTFFSAITKKKSQTQTREASSSFWLATFAEVPFGTKKAPWNIALTHPSGRGRLWEISSHRFSCGFFSIPPWNKIPVSLADGSCTPGCLLRETKNLQLAPLGDLLVSQPTPDLLDWSPVVEDKGFFGMNSARLISGTAPDAERNIPCRNGWEQDQEQCPGGDRIGKVGWDEYHRPGITSNTKYWTVFLVKCPHFDS